MSDASCVLQKVRTKRLKMVHLCHPKGEDIVIAIRGRLPSACRSGNSQRVGRSVSLRPFQP